jgi:hypothetical protein
VADANREAHREVFEEALDGYHRRLKAELEQRVRDLKAGRRINQYIGLPEPEDHTDDYDRVIMMAHMSVEDTITLSEDEFAMYVMDQWRWKQDFAETTLRYLRCPGCQPARTILFSERVVSPSQR